VHLLPPKGSRLLPRGEEEEVLVVRLLHPLPFSVKVRVKVKVKERVKERVKVKKKVKKKTEKEKEKE